MSININVTVGVTPALEYLLGALTGGAKATIETVEPQKKAAKALKEQKAEQAQPEEKKAPETAKEEPVAEETEKKAETAEKSSYTEEDIRQAMHECRLRIEGPDYKTNTTGDGYTKYHKNLTAWFKNQASLLGADKPSALPAEARKAFIDICKQATGCEDGSITV